SFTPHLFPLTPPSPPPLYTLSPHDALPISPIPCSNETYPIHRRRPPDRRCRSRAAPAGRNRTTLFHPYGNALQRLRRWKANPPRSEEHTSELQSRFDLVCRLLLEKKKILSQGRGMSETSAHQWPALRKRTAL